MQLLNINNEIVDIDEQTAIGLDIQGYDIKDPSTILMPVSNNFTIPKTKKNLRIIGFAGNPHSLSTTVYDTLSCNYSINNVFLIKNGIASITGVGERISVFASAKESIWGHLKHETWKQFNADFILWLQNNKGLPSIGNTFAGNFTQFITPYSTSTEGLFLPLLISNLYATEPPVESLTDIYLQTSSSLGGHFCVYVKTVFEFIEDFYNVDMSVLDSSIPYNIFDDPIVETMIVQLKNIHVYHVSANEHYFEYRDDIAFLPEQDISIDKEDKTLYDFTKIFFQYFNCLIDRKTKSDGSTKYLIRRFDDIQNADEINFSKKLTGDISFSPSVQNWKQNNYIKFSKIANDGSSTINSKYINCQNKNIEVGTTEYSLFSINMLIPNQFNYGGDYVLNLSESDALKEFTLMVVDQSAGVPTNVHTQTYSDSISLKLARLYALSSEYNTIESMMQYPVYYEIQKYLSFVEVNELQMFAKYHIPKLGGYFFLNKIKGFNPLRSNEPTKIELIKIP